MIVVYPTPNQLAIVYNSKGDGDSIFHPLFKNPFLIVVSGIDIEHQEIPDVISIPGIFIGLAASAFFFSENIAFSAQALMDSFFGVLAGGGSIFIMGFLGEKLFSKQAEEAGGAVGGGDVKLMAMIGAFL